MVQTPTYWKRYRRALILIALIFQFYGNSGLTGENSSHNPKLDLSIQAAAHQLLDMAQDDGRFVYRKDLDSKRNIKPIYNSIRHAGSIFALSQFEAAFPEERTRVAIKRGAQYLVNRFSVSLEKQTEPMFAISTRDLTTRDMERIELGGTALGIVALLSAEKIHANTTPPDILKGFGRFLIFMQKQNGAFYSHYRRTTSVRDDGFDSLYYPGESILALVMLYEWDNDEKWLKAAEKSLSYLVKTRTSVAKTPPDNWAMIATAKLWPYRHKLVLLTEKDLLRHADFVAQSDMRGQIENSQSPIAGGFVNDGRTTPTATRLEGLLSMWPLLASDQKELSSVIARSIQKGIDFLLRAQIEQGPFRGAIPKSVLAGTKHHGEIRIDYIQHALSAFLMYRKLQSQISSL